VQDLDGRLDDFLQQAFRSLVSEAVAREFRDGKAGDGGEILEIASHERKLAAHQPAVRLGHSGASARSRKSWMRFPRF
jgi:hypothetical protein